MDRLLDVTTDDRVGVVSRYKALHEQLCKLFFVDFATDDELVRMVEYVQRDRDKTHQALRRAERWSRWRKRNWKRAVCHHRAWLAEFQR